MARVEFVYRTTSTENKMESQDKTIVVAVDESEESMNALLWACKYLLPAQCPHGDTNKHQPCKFILLHIQPDACLAAGPAYIVSEDVVDLLEMDASRTTHKIFERALCICRDNNVKAETQVFVGEVKQRLCEAAGKLGADLLVMGSHGHGFFRRVLVGSLSDFCCQNAPCLVVVVKKNVCNNNKKVVSIVMESLTFDIMEKEKKI